MTVVEEVLLEAGPQLRVPEFDVPEEHRELVARYITIFDTQFSPGASQAEPFNKEMHPVQISSTRCEVVKYRNVDGKLVRSLEIPKKHLPSKHLRKATALSVTEDWEGNLQADIELFCFYQKSNGERTIIPGKKHVLEYDDYRFLRAATPLLGIKVR